MARKEENASQPRPHRVRRIIAAILKVLGTLLLVALLTTLVLACLFALYVKNDLSSQVDFSIADFSLDQTTVIYYEDPDTGENVVLQKLYGGENRTWVSYEKLPKNLIYACVAIEDKRFFDHHGVDWITTMRACIDIFLGKGDAGGSTITQQLIKNVTGNKEVTVRRKMIEIFQALEFEKTHTKEDILEWYLNIIGLGENCSGVQSASQVYFGKNVEELSLAECASLIGITNNPSIYDPYINPEKNKERQEVILSQMYKQGYITESQYNEAKNEKLQLRNNSGSGDDDSSDYYSYFVDQVIRDVVNDLCDKTGYAYDIVYKMVLTGGYEIYSTMNPKVQQEVDRVYQDLKNVPNTASSQQLQSGMVIVDNATGDIVALAGGVGEKEGSLTYSRATMSLLSPGSTIKPVAVYAPAIELGLITPASVYDDTPYSFTDTASWPKNSDSTYRGLTSINDAMCYSINTIPVKLVAEMTPEYCYSFAKDKMGLSTLVSNYVNSKGETLSDVALAPLALGGLTNGVTIRAMTAAYATFANEGVYRQARTYTKVTDNGGKNVVLDNTQNSYVAMKDMTAWYITYMLQNTVSYGSGTAAALDNMQVAGKTGTTTSDFDRWFAGYTPYYTGVVWCGYDAPEEVVLTDSTTNPAIVLWQKVMQGVHKNLKYAEFKKPTNVVECSVCYDSGLLATDACRADPRGNRVVNVELSLYDVPTESCTTHKMVKICGTSKHAVNEYCELVPGNTTYEVGLLDVTRGFPIRGIKVLDQAFVVPNAVIPSGYYGAVSPDVDAINVECYVHTFESIPEEEEEEEEEPEEEKPEDTEQEDDSGASGGTQVPDWEENSGIRP